MATSAKFVSRTQLAPAKSKPRRWRVIGVPHYFNEEALEKSLRKSPALQRLTPGLSSGKPPAPDNGAEVKSLAIEVRSSRQHATVTFANLPLELLSDKPISRTLTIFNKDGERPAEIKVTIDDLFEGLTVFYTPRSKDHQVDVLAVSGLGSHPFGSFASKEDGNMWLSDTLPEDMPSARVIVYGYNTRVHNSSSFADMDDLASSLQTAVVNLWEMKGKKALILLGHSMGGLVIKQMLARMLETESLHDLLHHITGALFFGVPNDGMDVDPLIKMTEDQPNRFLVESMSRINSMVWNKQSQEFRRVLAKTQLQVLCFYETNFSPTPAKNAQGEWTMTGEKRCLVTKQSATSCIRDGQHNECAISMDREHSNLVKFNFHDAEYEKLLARLQRIPQQAFSPIATQTETTGIVTRSVPSPSPDPRTEEKKIDKNRWFLGFPDREELWVPQKRSLLEEKLISRSHKTRSRRYETFFVTGEAGIGKTAFAKKVASAVKKKFYALLLVDLRTPQSAEEGLAYACNRIWERSHKSIEDALEALSTIDKPWVLFLDNVDEPIFFDRWFSKWRFATIVVISRKQQLDKKYCTLGTITLEALTEIDAMKAFCHFADIHEAEKQKSASAIESLVVKHLQCHPLATVLAAAYIRCEQSTLEDYSILLEDAEDSIQYKELEPKAKEFLQKDIKFQHTTLESVIEASLKVLQQETSTKHQDGNSLLGLLGILESSWIERHILEKAWKYFVTHVQEIHDVSNDDDNSFSRLEISKWNMEQLPGFLKDSSGQFNSTRLKALLDCLQELHLVRVQTGSRRLNAMKIWTHRAINQYIKLESTLEDYRKHWAQAATLLAFASVEAYDIHVRDRLPMNIQDLMNGIESWNALGFHPVELSRLLFACYLGLKCQSLFKLGHEVLQRIFAILDLRSSEPSASYIELYVEESICVQMMMPDDMSKAIGLLQKVNGVCERDLRQDSPLRIRAQNELASAYEKCRSDELVTFLESVRMFRGGVFGVTSPEYKQVDTKLKSMTNSPVQFKSLAEQILRADELCRERRYSECIRILRDVQKAYTESSEAEGRDHLIAKRRLAMALSESRQREEAIREFSELEDIIRRKRGEKTYECEEARYFLARECLNAGPEQIPKSIEILHRMLKIAEEKGMLENKTSHRVSGIRWLLGIAYRECGEARRSLEFLEAAVEADEAANRSTLTLAEKKHDLAKAYWACEDFARCVTQLEQLKLLEEGDLRSQPPNNNRLPMVRHFLASAYRMNNQGEQAEALVPTGRYNIS